MTPVAAGGILGVVNAAVGRGERVGPILVSLFRSDVNNGHPFLLVEPPAKGQNMVLVEKMVRPRLGPFNLASHVILKKTRADCLGHTIDSSDAVAFEPH